MYRVDRAVPVAVDCRGPSAKGPFIPTRPVDRRSNCSDTSVFAPDKKLD
jgi:hypothetical protein